MSAASSSASKNAGSVGGPPAVPHLDIDPFAIAFFDDPFPAQQALRDAAPIVYLDKWNV